MQLPEIRRVPIQSLVAPPSNPNVMLDDAAGLLRANIEKKGFLQPPLVREPTSAELAAAGADEKEARAIEAAARLGCGAFYRIIDGVHRVDAAREAGLTEIDVVIVNVTDEEAKALTIAMNKLRGDLDLGAVAKVLTELRDGGNWTVEQITLTGFSTGEIDDLLKAASSNPDDVMNGTAGSTQDEDPEPPQGTFDLTISFEHAADMRRAKAALRKAAGKGNELSVGLLKLLGE